MTPSSATTALWTLRPASLVNVSLCAAYVLVFVLGLLGNMFVLVAVYRNATMRTATNIFIANLAVADLLVTVVCMPSGFFTNLLAGWTFGEGLCKLVAYLQAVSVNASINSLVAISMDRCLVVSSPLGSVLGGRRTRYWVAATWCVPVFIMFPWLYVFEVRPVQNDNDVTHHPVQICADFWQNKANADVFFIIVNLLMSYIIPVVMITICYAIIFKKILRRRMPGVNNAELRRQLHSRSRMQVIKMILAVTVSFALFWLPLYVIFCVSKFTDIIDTQLEEDEYSTLLLVAQWLATANSSTNPLIYSYFSDNYRNEFKWFVSKMHESCSNCSRNQTSTTNACHTESSNLCAASIKVSRMI